MKIYEYIFDQITDNYYLFKHELVNLGSYLCPGAAEPPGAARFQEDRGMSPAEPKPPQDLYSQYTKFLF